MSYDSLKNLCEEIYQLNFEPYLYGRKDLFMGVMAAYLSRGHVLVEGPPGTAKTLIAKLLARTFSKSFKRIQFTDDLVPKQIIGAHYWHQGKNEYKFQSGPLFSEIILADEINRAPPRTQSAFLEAMEERQLSIEGNTLDLGENFFVVATQNPSDYAGTHPLPDVQLDRFIFSYRLQHSSIDQEVLIVQKHLDNLLPPQLNSLKTFDFNMGEMQALIRAVNVDEKLIKKAALIVSSTRNSPYFEKGASLRAILAIIKGSQAHAAMLGRNRVELEDIVSLAIPALRHRVVLSDAAKKTQRPIEGYIQDILGELNLKQAA
jgi:MoxR-like ATPase